MSPVRCGRRGGPSHTQQPSAAWQPPPEAAPAGAPPVAPPCAGCLRKTCPAPRTWPAPRAAGCTGRGWRRQACRPVGREAQPASCEHRRPLPPLRGRLQEPPPSLTAPSCAARGEPLAGRSAARLPAAADQAARGAQQPPGSPHRPAPAHWGRPAKIAPPGGHPPAGVAPQAALPASETSPPGATVARSPEQRRWRLQAAPPRPAAQPARATPARSPAGRPAHWGGAPVPGSRPAARPPRTGRPQACAPWARGPPLS
mmetsp:Transcript_11862/g.29828  ORF Transcript_11862/g.29828 Transcript_11862/m.29828 type:complete len:257 (-) Transcript_11862:3805-4575(-)